MDNKLNNYVQVNYSKETDNTVTMTVELPQEDPRRNIPPIVFNRNDAMNLAASEYGSRLDSVSHADTLDNSPPANVLKGTYELRLTPVSSTTATVAKSKTSSPRRKTRTKTKTKS